MQLCLFSSTPDMLGLDFVVKVLTGHPEELAQRAVDWGYDGIEFMPNPDNLPNPQHVERALKAAGALMPVVNTGRMFSQGMALLHREAGVRQRSLEAYRSILGFAGYFGSRVGLGIARGQEVLGSRQEEMDEIADGVLRCRADTRTPATPVHRSVDIHRSVNLTRPGCRGIFAWY